MDTRFKNREENAEGIKLSIILPCYNMAPYVRRCVESIYREKLDFGFEVIAVDDASTDSTLQELRQLSREYPGLRVVEHEVNGKLTGARTTGMRAARGEYVMHLDPDDYLIAGALGRVMAPDLGCDIVMANIIIETPESRITGYNMTQGVYDLNNAYERALLFSTVSRGSCFGKMFRRELLADMVYHGYNYNLGEDRAFNLEVFARAGLVHYINIPLYHYCYNAASLDRDKSLRPGQLDWEQSWVSNTGALYEKGVLTGIALRYARREVARFDLAMLRRVRRCEDVPGLFAEWRRYMAPQCRFLGIRGGIVKRLLKLKNIRVAYPLFVPVLADWSALPAIIRKKLGR